MKRTDRSGCIPRARPEFERLTWDRGMGLADHRNSPSTVLQVFFTDPRSPWQPGTNEKTNGLLRQYLPKGKSMAG